MNGFIRPEEPAKIVVKSNSPGLTSLQLNPSTSAVDREIVMQSTRLINMEESGTPAHTSTVAGLLDTAQVQTQHFRSLRDACRSGQVRTGRVQSILTGKNTAANIQL